MLLYLCVATRIDTIAAMRGYELRIRADYSLQILDARHVARYEYERRSVLSSKRVSEKEATESISFFPFFSFSFHAWNYSYNSKNSCEGKKDKFIFYARVNPTVTVTRNVRQKPQISHSYG